MGLSENSVPLHPMVNDHYPYYMAIIGGIPHFQTYPDEFPIKSSSDRYLYIATFDYQTVSPALSPPLPRHGCHGGPDGHSHGMAHESR